MRRPLTSALRKTSALYGFILDTASEWCFLDNKQSSVNSACSPKVGCSSNVYMPVCLVYAIKSPVTTHSMHGPALCLAGAGPEDMARFVATMLLQLLLVAPTCLALRAVLSHGPCAYISPNGFSGRFVGSGCSHGSADGASGSSSSAGSTNATHSGYQIDGQSSCDTGDDFKECSKVSSCPEASIESAPGDSYGGGVCESVCCKPGPGFVDECSQLCAVCAPRTSCMPFCP